MPRGVCKSTTAYRAAVRRSCPRRYHFIHVRARITDEPNLHLSSSPVQSQSSDSTETAGCGPLNCHMASVHGHTGKISQRLQSYLVQSCHALVTHLLELRPSFHSVCHPTHKTLYQSLEIVAGISPGLGCLSVLPLMNRSEEVL